MKLALSVALVACAALVLVAADGSPAPTSPVEPAAVTGGIVTLNVLDGETCSFSLMTGKAGGMVQDHEMRNVDSSVVFGRYHDGELSIGMQGGEDGHIVDLGSVDELRARYGFGDTVPGRQGFSSLHFDQGSFLIRGRADSGESFQRCPEANTVLLDPAVADHAPVALDHVYVLRLTSTHDPSFDLRAKLHVIGYQSGQSVTLRWERLHP